MPGAVPYRHMVARFVRYGVLLGEDEVGGIMNNALYPCRPWPVDPRCCDGWPQDPDAWSEDHCQAQMLATVDLWRAVGGIIGLCDSVVRPCRDRCGSRRLDLPWMQPYIRDGAWFNDGGCGCRTSCSCSQLCTVTLPGPVHEVYSVQVGGVTLPSSAWRVVTDDRLARVDGDCWPSCQDFSKPDADGFTVTYSRGVPPGVDAIRAVSLLACRYFQTCGGGGGCGDIPSTATSVQREGYTLGFDRRVGDGSNYQGVSTGIGYVDDWIERMNPYSLTQGPAVWSPDIDSPVVFYDVSGRRW